MAGLKVSEAVERGAGLLAANSELAATARRDAEVLLLGVVSLSRAELRAHPESELTEAEEARFWLSVYRRKMSEPMQYILGEQEFFGLRLRVSPAVLIPRPETELLVEAVLERLPAGDGVRVVDVGTGSGAIAVAVAVHRPRAEVTAVDLSAAALGVARENAGAHGVGRIRFMESDLLGAVAGERFECVVSNPPYVAEEDRGTLELQVREYEPGLALFGGAEGLELYRRLIPQAEGALVEGGLLALEMGFGQREAVAEMLAGWAEVSFLDDLGGIARVALARRAGPR